VEEVELPEGEIAPLVLDVVTSGATGPMAQAMDSIAEDYLNNLEKEIASGTPAPKGIRSNAAQRADQSLRAIVGYQAADRIDRENFLNSKR
jgi:hypothetical protein